MSPLGRSIASNEAAIAVPADNHALRLAYALPATQPIQAVQHVQAPLMPPANITPPANMVPVASAPTTRQMAVTLSPVSPTSTDIAAPTQTEFSPINRSADGLPWISGSAPRSTLAVAPQPVQQAAYLAPAPRVRLPGYSQQGQTFVQPELSAVPGAPPSTPAGSVDGFRPRGVALPSQTASTLAF